MAVGAAALDAAEQARRAAELAERASATALDAGAGPAAPRPGRPARTMSLRRLQRAGGPGRRRGCEQLRAAAALGYLQPAAPAARRRSGELAPPTGGELATPSSERARARRRAPSRSGRPRRRRAARRAERELSAYLDPGFAGDLDRAARAMPGRMRPSAGGVGQRSVADGEDVGPRRPPAPGRRGRGGAGRRPASPPRRLQQRSGRPTCERRGRRRATTLRRSIARSRPGKTSGALDLAGELRPSRGRRSRRERSSAAGVPATSPRARSMTRSSRARAGELGAEERREAGGEALAGGPRARPVRPSSTSSVSKTPLCRVGMWAAGTPRLF